MKALLVLLLALSTSHALDCQQIGDLQSCTEGPDFVMAISGSATGSGHQEHSLEAAGQLIQSVNDAYPRVEDWCFLLETHGFETDGHGRMWINGTEFAIFENGSIFERLT